MVISIKNDEGYILGYLSYYTVCPSGFPKFEGKYLWVHDLWIHEDYRGCGKLTELVNKMLEQVPYITHGYWTRSKYGGRLSKLYPKDTFTKIYTRMDKI
jgi:hypothetical protein